MITEATKKNIVSQAKAYMEEKNLSQTKLARFCDVSTAYMSDIMKGKVVTGTKDTPITDDYFVKIAQTIGFKIEESHWRHFDTDNFHAINTTLNDARISRVPYAIDGDTGAGKTYAVELYKRQFPRETYVVRCDEDLTAKSFMEELAYSIGLKPMGAAYNIRKNVIKKLQDDQNPLLIIDEAENLKDRAWGSIKRILDDLKGKAGIVFVGANDFQAMLRKKADKMRGCYPQVYSRIKEGGFTRLFKMEYDDVVGICQSLGIKSKKVTNGLFDSCDNMRELAGSIKRLKREAKATNKPIEELYEILIAA